MEPQTTTFTNLTGLGVPHAVFTRQGGVSPTPYQSLNVGLKVGDHKDHVSSNRRIIREHLGLSCLVSTGQVHGDSILLLETIPEEKEVEYPGHDALMSNLPHLGLMIQQADCQAVLLYDSKHRAVANVHSGWRGSVLNLIAKTIAAMKKAYGTSPASLHAAISPSLGPCCGEFRNYARELPAAFLPYQIRPDHFDFWAISRAQLKDCGVKTAMIETAGICTVCDSRFFSYRREKTTGRFASVIAAPGSQP